MKDDKNIEDLDKAFEEIDEKSRMIDELIDKKRKIREEKRIKRLRKTQLVKGAFIGGALATIITTSVSVAMPVIEGKNYITENFEEDVLKDVGIQDSSSGYHINIGKTYVSFKDGCDYIYERANMYGYSDAEIYIAISKLEGSDFAKNIVEKPDFDEILAASKNAYHKKELNEEIKNGK